MTRISTAIEIVWMTKTGVNITPRISAAKVISVINGEVTIRVPERRSPVYLDEERLRDGVCIRVSDSIGSGETFFALERAVIEATTKPKQPKPKQPKPKQPKPKQPKPKQQYNSSDASKPKSVADALRDSIKSLTRQMMAAHPDRGGNARDFAELSAQRDQLQSQSSSQSAEKHQETVQPTYTWTGPKRTRKTREQLRTRASWKLEPLSTNPGLRELIEDLQVKNNVGGPGIRWDIMFTRTPPENIGNGQILLEYLLDADAIRRKAGLRWEELQEAGLTDYSALNKYHKKVWGMGDSEV